MSDLEMKSFGPFEIKNEARGEVVAVVSSLDVVDHDREVVRSTSIKGGASKVKISFYGHGTAFGEAPVGKGVIAVEDGKGVLRGNFFMSTTRGREAFETVKALGGDGEWSIGFRVLKDSKPDEEWKGRGAERMIDEIELFEVSPVLRGASPNTATLAVKSEGTEPQAPEPEPVFEAPPSSDIVAIPLPEPVDVPAEPEPEESAEAKAAREAEVAHKANVDAAMKAAVEIQGRLAKSMRENDSVQQVQRALKRIGGYAA
jgi:phage head maturation protease